MKRRRTCRGCGGEVPPHRLSWCGDDCVEAWTLLHWWVKARAKRIETDGGVCQQCGRAAVALQEAAEGIRHRLLEWDRWTKDSSGWRTNVWNAIAAQVSDAGFPAPAGLFGSYRARSFVEVDHIHARADGGDHRQENLRTLCVPCHKRRTKEQRAERAAAKRERKRRDDQEAP